MAKYRKSKVYSLICNKKSESEKEEVKLEISDGYNNEDFGIIKTQLPKDACGGVLIKPLGFQ